MSNLANKGSPSSASAAALRRVAAFLRTVRHTPDAGKRPHVSLATGKVVPIDKTIWGSPAGKKILAPRLVKLILPHKTYVEPFAGTAAVFFEKEPAETEVLSDADPEISFALKVLTTLTDSELAALKKKDWTARERTFHALHESNPRGRVEKLYRFLYVSRFSYGKMRGKSYNAADDGVECHTIARIEKHRDRLRSVRVRAGHYAAVVKEFDGKNTFFFLDPPYPGHNVKVGEDQFDETEFRQVLEGIKGKFLITYGMRGDLDTSGFHVRKIRTPRTMRSMRGVGGPKTLGQLLITNYALTQKSLGPYMLDEVEAALELDAAAAVDLEHARVLVKALASELDRPSIAALAQALDRFEGVSDDRVEVLAGELLRIGDRLIPATEVAAPQIAGGMRHAMPALAQLAKTAQRPAVVNSRPAVPSETASDHPAAAAAEQARLPLAVILDKRIPLLKTGEERYVLGIVLEPETIDAQKDIYAAAEVREAAARTKSFLANVVPLYQRRGTKRALQQLLQLYLNPDANLQREAEENIEILEDSPSGAAFPPRYFQVRFSVVEHDPQLLARRAAIATAIIDREKPAHTFYGLRINFPSLQIATFDATNPTRGVYVGVNTTLGGDFVRL